MKLNGILAPLCLAFAAHTCCAQPFAPYDYDSPVYRYWYSPVDAAVAQIYDYSNLVRSAAARNYAESRESNARAAAQETINSLNEVRAYHKKKEIARAARLQKEISTIDRLKSGNSKRWKIIASLPELNGRNAVVSGNSLNFLLNRMDGTMLAYEFTHLSYQDDKDLREKLALNPEVVKGLRLRQPRRGGFYEFGADAGEVLDVSWWPFALRDEKFAKERGTFIDVRNRLAENAKHTREISGSDLAKLNDAMIGLWSAIRSHFTRDIIFGQPNSFLRYREVDTFLKGLDWQIRRLEDTSDASAFTGQLRFDMAKDGRDLISFLTFVAQNGMEFAPARPGDESSYHTLHRMMRDVYSLVADEDPGLKPQKTKKDTVSPDVLELEKT